MYWLSVVADFDIFGMVEKLVNTKKIKIKSNSKYIINSTFGVYASNKMSFHIQ